MSETELRHRGRRVAANALGRAGNAASRVSRRLAADAGPTLAGDRWVEWSFCCARLAEGQGRTLDFGADVGFLSLAAAFRGHDVVAFDRLPSSLQYTHDRVVAVQGDILDSPPAGPFDQIINCSSVEHVGLGGRYGSPDEPDGDLKAMSALNGLLAPAGRMILTIPVGRDAICQPFHRVYGQNRLPQLLDGYAPVEEQYWRKDAATGKWEPCDRDLALEEKSSASFYALGLFVLRPAP